MMAEVHFHNDDPVNWATITITHEHRVTHDEFGWRVEYDENLRIISSTSYGDSWTVSDTFETYTVSVPPDGNWDDSDNTHSYGSAEYGGDGITYSTYDEETTWVEDIYR